MRLRDREPGISVLMIGCIMLFVISICGCTKIFNNCCQCQHKNIQGSDIHPWPNFPGIFYGTVTSSTTGAGIPGERMYFDCTSPSVHTYSDRLTTPRGYYESAWMSPGTYTVKAAALGYATATTTVHLPSNTEISKDFRLMPLP